MDHDTVEEIALPDHRTYTSMTMEGEAAVGRIAIWAAWLEHMLGYLCSALIGARHGVGPALTEEMPASKLMHTARKLAKSGDSPLSPELQDQVVEVLEAAKQALEQRNKILHASVGGTFTQGTTAFHSRRLDAKGRTQAAIYSPNELDGIGAKIHEAMQAVWECTGDVEFALREFRNQRS